MKKWQIVTLIAFAALDLIVLGIGFAIVVMPPAPNATPVAAIPLQTVVAPTQAATPRVASTAGPTISPADSNYVRDHLTCDKLYYSATVRDIANLLAAIDNDTIRNVDTCNTMVASASTVLEDANACADKTHIPEDVDLLEHRQHILAYLESARSMWFSIGTYCRTGTQDPKLQQFTDKTGVELGKASDTMDVYLKRHSEDRETVIPSPATIAVAVSQTLTALPQKQTVTPTPTKPPTQTPRPTPTATLRVTENDFGYAQDMSKCTFYFQQVSKNSYDLSAAIKSGAIYNTDFCATLAAIAIVNLEDAYSCTNNSRIPDDSDLRSSRQFYLSGLQDAKSAWFSLGLGCKSKTIDQRIPSLMSQASDEMDKGTQALNRYLDLHGLK